MQLKAATIPLCGVLSLGKHGFIEQAFRGDSSVRSMEDVSEASAFEMAAALASGDERYLKLAGLKGDVERLGRLYSAHIDEQKRFAREKAILNHKINIAPLKLSKLTRRLHSASRLKQGSFSQCWQKPLIIVTSLAKPCLKSLRSGRILQS